MAMINIGLNKIIPLLMLSHKEPIFWINKNLLLLSETTNK